MMNSLQFSAIVYEHPNESVRDAISATEEAEEAQGLSHPTGLFSMAPIINKAVSLVQTSEWKSHVILTHCRIGLTAWPEIQISLNPLANKKVDDALASDGDDIIRDFASPFGIEFEPLSELNNTSSAVSRYSLSYICAKFKHILFHTVRWCFLGPQVYLDRRCVQGNVTNWYVNQD